MKIILTPSHDPASRKFDEVGLNLTEDIVSVGAFFKHVSFACSFEVPILISCFYFYAPRFFKKRDPVTGPFIASGRRRHRKAAVF